MHKWHNSLVIEMQEKQETNKPLRDELGRLLPGHTANPNGRPKGETMKEFSRQWFFQMSNEEKIAYIANIEKVRPGFAWTMSEGNPTEDKTVTVRAAVPILGGSSQAVTLENAADTPLIEDTTSSHTTSPQSQSIDDTL